MIPASYGHSIPDVGKDAHVVIADFSYLRPQMLELAAAAGSVTVLDHHKTAEANLVDLPSNVETVFDMDRSGAGIVLGWLHDRKLTLPIGAYDMVPYIQDYDLWRKELPHTEEVSAYHSSLRMNLENWYIFGRQMAADKSVVFATGASLMRYRDKLVEHTAATAREIDILGHKVLIAASPYALGSLVAEKLCTGENADRPFGAYYVPQPWGTQFGLRSRDDFSVREVAERLGGGGHDQAAGFRINGAWDFENPCVLQSYMER